MSEIRSLRRHAHFKTGDEIHTFGLSIIITHPQKYIFIAVFLFTFFCDLIVNQVICLFVLEDPLTSDRCLSFLGGDLQGLLDVPLQIKRILWLQQDGAPHNFVRLVTVFLNQQFQNRWIERQGPLAWPSRSPDLTPLDY
jgi:hypothetical protein